MNSPQTNIFLESLFHIHFLFYVLVILVISTTVSCGNETDHEALLEIKSMITHDPHGSLISWNNSLHFCDWNHVYCGKQHRRVTYLGLKSLGLEGTLSPHVGNLSFLRGLSLRNNSFQGDIPHEISRLFRLRFLYLASNKFKGVIPANISGCSSLVELDLSYNELVGRIPKEITFLSKLTSILLYYNKLSGGITSFLGNITSLRVFSATGNMFGGTIPDTLSNCKSLEEIYCGVCNLSGSIPPSLYNLSLLTGFSFSQNQLTGSLPPAIGVMLPNLVLFQLDTNHLTGLLPSSICNCSRLQYLEMSKNKFRGKLTIDFAKLGEIKFLSLSSNTFGSKEADEMKFVDSLKNCTSLEVLSLNNCTFQGELPRSIGNLSNQLRTLTLEYNQLHGYLPRSIGNLVGMISLYLGFNQFIGYIPSTIGNLQNLQGIELSVNQLSGTIPQAIGNLSSLTYLDLSSNMLEGVIPSSLGKCHNLLELYFSDNKLNGKIPMQLLQLSSLSVMLDLSQNNLFGTLPMEVGYLKMLSGLDLSDNNLSGNIPDSLSSCASLSSLYLKGNKFQGMIPPSFSSLKALVELDVSYNNLSGQIPRFLDRLQYLNLSYNDFEGEVPTSGVFANATSFSVFGNIRLCGGFVDLELPKCIKVAKKQKEKLPLFVVLILIAVTLFIIICLTYVWCRKKNKNPRSQSSTSKRFLKLSYNQLLKATNGFSEANLIGNGGFSSVYKGIIDEYDDRFVAVKVIHLQNRGAQRSFMMECEALRNIRHRNLLKIITSCSSVDFQGNDFKALVYEFMPNGSLHDWLHSSERESRLELHQIIKILIDVACAVNYIHNECLPCVVHGDLKPSNILLDDDMVAHVGDFGLARFLGMTSYQNSSTGIMGTIGYAAPEYGLGSEMSNDGDVYSFGILLLEAITGKNPRDAIFNEDLNLHKFASMALPDSVNSIIDINILNFYEDGISMPNKEENAKIMEECLVSIVKIGVSCSMDSPPQRMDIKKVVHELQNILDTVQILYTVQNIRGGLT